MLSRESRLYTYAQRSRLLLDIIKYQPENSYAYTALLSCFISRYSEELDEPEMFTSMAEVLGIIDITAASIPRVENNEHYQAKKVEFFQLFDQVIGSSHAEQYFDDLLEKGSGVGVYIKASMMVREAGLKYNVALTEKTKITCQKVLALLDDKRYSNVVQNHAAIQYMRLQLTWLWNNGRPIFEHERQTTRITEEGWLSIYGICSDFSENIIEKHPECPYVATVYYIMALASAQLGEFAKSVELWRRVREDDFYNLGRSYTWHVISTPEGEPKLFTGTFNRRPLPENRIYIKEINIYAFYRSLQSINKSAPNGDAASLCIGTSYRGFSAFARNWKPRREQ